MNTIQTKTNSLQKILYPFSVPIEEGLDTYSFVLPSLPEGKKAIVIVLDAFRGDYLGKKLDGIPVTPNMHRLAKENLYFPNYRVQAPWTKASVSSFFTGHYLRDHATFLGARNEGQLQETLRKYKKQKLGDRDWLYSHVLPEKFRTLAERLEGEGYKNAGLVAMAPIAKGSV